MIKKIKRCRKVGEKLLPSGKVCTEQLSLDDWVDECVDKKKGGDR